MTICRMFAVLTALLVLGAAVAGAGPNRGFGIMGGTASHTGTITITEGAFEGQEFDFESSGFSWGVDYQFALGSAFSFNIFFQGSSESVDKPEEFDTAYHAVLGLQLRRWFDTVFIGAHVGNYSEILKDEMGESTSGTGIGGGVVLGFEADGGFYVALQADSVTVEFSDSETELIATRVQIGFRF